MNENQLICKTLRKEFSKVGWALLAYYGIMNLAILLSSLVMGVIAGIQMVLTPGMTEEGYDRLLENVIQDATWGYAVAVVVGAVLLLIWKKPKFCFEEIWEQKKPMTVGSFFALLAIFISGQGLFQVLTPLLEWLFGLMGISLMDSIASASGNTDHWAMFLYVGLLAPVWEEILFRGYVMRTLKPYGKRFAIFASAFLFGIYHGNVVQSPYAFAVGLVLGYVAMEYSMLWAMVLHMINNLLLGDTIGRLVQDLPVQWQEITFLVLIWGCVVAGIIVLICKRKAVAAYFKEGKMHPLCLKSFFTSPGVITLTVILFGLTTVALFLS